MLLSCEFYRTIQHKSRGERLAYFLPDSVAAWLHNQHGVSFSFSAQMEVYSQWEMLWEFIESLSEFVFSLLEFIVVGVCM